MKDAWRYAIPALLAALLAFAFGCSPRAEEPRAEEGEAAARKEVKFTLSLTGATPAGGGVWDMIGAGLAEAIMRNNPGSVVTVVPGGGVSTVPVVSKGEAELGLTHSPIAAAGLKGIEPFQEKFENITAITSLYTSKLQFIVSPDLNLKSVADIKDRPIRLAVGDPGSTGELATKRLLQAHGLSYEDYERLGGRIVFKDMSEAASMFGDGLIDGFVLLTLDPAGPLLEISATKKVALLGLDEEVIAKMKDQYGYDSGFISKASYDFLDGDIPTMTSQVVLAARAELPDDQAYCVTRGLVEELDYIREIHKNLRDLTVEKMSTGTGAPLHPGAREYYDEVSVKKVP